MGFGFKRLVDLSSLSIKQLNDQLEQVWLKVMGGIGQRDLDRALQNTISSKVSEEDFSSLIEQNTKTIQLAVGRSHGENLVKNPCAGLGLSYWTCTSRIEARTDHIGPCFYLADNNGADGHTGKRQPICGGRAVRVCGCGGGLNGIWI